MHHPPLPDWERQKVRNDDSLVIELRYGQVSMLLTGDIGREVEQALLPTLDLLPIVVLKSPHHGSGTSSSDEFIRAIRPQLVLIGAGRANPYGHPVPYVLDRYRAVGARVYRTDLRWPDRSYDRRPVAGGQHVRSADGNVRRRPAAVKAAQLLSGTGCVGRRCAA